MLNVILYVKYIFLSCLQGLLPDLEGYYDIFKPKNKESTAESAFRKIKKSFKRN